MNFSKETPCNSTLESMLNAFIKQQEEKIEFLIQQQHEQVRREERADLEKLYAQEFSNRLQDIQTYFISELKGYLDLVARVAESRKKELQTYMNSMDKLVEDMKKKLELLKDYEVDTGNTVVKTY